jgi:hypothetical protein
MLRIISILVANVISSASILNFLPIDNTNYCTNFATSIIPSFSNKIKINKVAIPLNIINTNQVPIIRINNKNPSNNPELICMTGCNMPPCEPLHNCNQNDIYWSISYDDLIVEPMEHLEFNNLILQNQGVIAIFYDEYIPTIQNTSNMQCKNNTIIINNTIPVSNQEYQNIDYLKEVSNSLNPWIISLTILLSFSIILVFSYLCVSKYKNRVKRNYSKCPYCNQSLKYIELKEHLNNCKEHLELFEFIEKVKILDNKVNHQNIRIDDNSSKILVFSRKKERLVNPKNLEIELEEIPKNNSETSGLVGDKYDSD